MASHHSPLPSTLTPESSHGSQFDRPSDIHSEEESRYTASLPENVQNAPRILPLNRERDSRKASATRPQLGDIYSQPEIFPEHDLDEPVIEADSDETSLTASAQHTLSAPPPKKVEKGRLRIEIPIHVVTKNLVNWKPDVDTSSDSNTLPKRGVKNNPSPGQSGLGITPMATTFEWVRGQLIKRGTYGQVYLAMNATIGEIMVVKQFERPNTRYSHYPAALQELDHPNIVQYLGFEETPDIMSIFFEHVPGGSIESYLLVFGKFEENVTKWFTGQILTGLEYLHSQNIPHRNLKADNILVEMSGACKISGIDISKKTEDIKHSSLRGSLYWMAPEVIRTENRKGCNYKADIWSVGCVVLEMWTAMLPWMSSDASSVMSKLYHMEQPPLPENVVLSELAEDFRQMCFAINPEARPSASELREHRYLTLPPGWVFTFMSFS